MDLGGVRGVLWTASDVLVEDAHTVAATVCLTYTLHTLLHTLLHWCYT